jgi:hypothetical protein
MRSGIVHGLPLTIKVQKGTGSRPCALVLATHEFELTIGKWNGLMFPISNPSRNNLPSMAVSLGNCLEYTLEWKILSLVEFVEYLECQEGGKNAGCLGQVIFDIMGMKVMNPLILLPSEAS